MTLIRLSDGTQYSFAALPATMANMELMAIIGDDSEPEIRRVRALIKGARLSLGRTYEAGEVDRILGLIDMDSEEVVSALVGAMFLGGKNGGGAAVVAPDGAGGVAVGDDACGGTSGV